MALPYAGPSHVDLKPDTDTAWHFLCWWFKECTQGQIELGWMVPETGALTGFQRFDIESEAILSVIEHVNSVPGRSLYVRAATISATARRGHSTDSDVLQSPGVWADLDSEAQVEHARTVQSMLRANGWVTTGKHPHPRYQRFFRTSEPLTNPDTIKTLNQRLMRIYGGDPSVANPSRLMRLPGTIAWPYKAGRVPEMTSFDEAPSDRPKVYPISTLTSQLPELDQPAPTPPPPPPPISELFGLLTASTYLARIRAGDHWHDHMVKLVAHWIGRGWSNTEIMAAAESITLAGYTAEQTRDEMGKAIRGGREKWGKADHEELIGAEEAVFIFPATPLSWEEMEAVGVRRWVYGHFLIRQFVSVLGAPGGTGKTAYAFAVACAIATGQELLGETVHEPGNVWIYNLEDPRDELLRRFRAAVIHYGLDRAEIEDRVFLDSGRDRALVVATVTKDGTAIASPLVPLVIEEVKRRNIRLLLVDPFVRSHRLTENDNDHIDFAAALWGEVAEKADCCILLLHHFRKGGVSGDAAAFRGASALIDAARAAISLAVMSPEEADKLGVPDDERWQYIRADNAKLNLAPPPDRTLWLKLTGVPLANGGLAHPGDTVQTVARWEPPSPWEGIPMATIVRILDRIADGPDPDEKYTLRNTSSDKSRWAGQMLVEEAGVTDGQATAILRAWQDSGVVKPITYRSAAQRKDRTGCSVDRAKVAEMRQTISDAGDRASDL